MLDMNRNRHFSALFTSDLFKQVQLSEMFEDSKTFADAIAKQPIEVILALYAKDHQKIGFNLSEFVARHFELPETQELKSQLHAPQLDVQIAHLWQVLRKDADKPVNDSLIPLPNAYTVPGGRFREVYYWDSYFAAIGLVESGDCAAVENLLENFVYLQQSVGLIPNGNRWYYSGRSQPPIMALLLDLLVTSTSLPEPKLERYLAAIESEYAFWMQGEKELKPGHQSLRVCRMPCGALLNRYFDNNDGPRPESFAEDVALKSTLNNDSNASFFRDVRAACESGWDFSSRWLKGRGLETIATTQVLPVDLNALLYFTECFLATNLTSIGRVDDASRYERSANNRKAAIDKYFWNREEGCYFDYWLDDRQQSSVSSLACAWPLFVGASDAEQAEQIAVTLAKKFLKPGGLVTTTLESGQQWDAPNGWAPLQWIAIQGLQQYGYETLAIKCASRWLDTVSYTYQTYGKFMEKYNVVTPHIEASGGEYHVQEGFGWTNGVTMGLISYLSSRAPEALSRLALSNSKLNGLET